MSKPDKLNIVVDENIPCAQKLFGEFGELVALPGRSIRASDVEGADALIVRSVTKVNEALLKSSSLGFVGTCTIGTDHIDLSYLQQKGIAFASAPGCNANAVVQYVICALQQLDSLKPGAKAAIVGCGNVGRRVYQNLSALGLNCVGVDPHLGDEHGLDLVSIDDIFDADIVCMHTPLVVEGSHPSLNLMNADRLKKLKRDAVLLNAGRGECIDNQALYEYCLNGKAARVVLDVWAGEPDIHRGLTSLVDIGTPHIAGYSYEGKINGSTMIFEALSRHLGKEASWVQQKIAEVQYESLGEAVKLEAHTLPQALQAMYSVSEDHQRFLKRVDDFPKGFDALRKDYPKRREFTHYYLPDDEASVNNRDRDALRAIGVG